jgi:hypothetical protein
VDHRYRQFGLLGKIKRIFGEFHVIPLDSLISSWPTAFRERASPQKTADTKAISRISFLNLEGNACDVR